MKDGVNIFALCIQNNQKLIERLINLMDQNLKINERNNNTSLF